MSFNAEQIECLVRIGKAAQAEAEKQVDAILADLTDRSGLGDAWSEIDAGIQAEIREAWVKILIS